MTVYAGCEIWNVNKTTNRHTTVPQVKRKMGVLIWVLCCGAFGLVSSAGTLQRSSSRQGRNLICNTPMVANSIFCQSIPHDRLYRDKMSTLHAWPPRTITFGVFTSHFWSLETEVHNEIWAHAEGITNWKQLPLGAFQSNPCYAAQAFHIVCIQCRTRGTSDSNTRSGKAMFYLRQCISI